MIKNGVWSTMITPFTEENELDYDALAALIEWYIEKGVVGIFAVCQSSEMDFLSLKEKVEVTRFIAKKINGRIGLVTSGHTADTIPMQIKELLKMSEENVDAIVLITNKLAKESDSEDVFKENLLKVINALPSKTKFGLYERPFPYKRLLSSELLKWIVTLDKFVFLKDASCNMEIIKSKLEVIKGSKLKLFNANTATLIESVKAGAHGYCGVMANFHPECYSVAMDDTVNREIKDKVESFITLSSVIECQNYPKNSKYYLNLNGVKMGDFTRVDATSLNISQKLELQALSKLSKQYALLF